jgi:tetratricopeptide (TPR) repeat protein
LGNLLSELCRYEEAETIYRKAISLNPQEAPTYFNLAVLLHENMGRYDDAEIAYQKAIELDPFNAHFYSGLINLFRFSFDNRLEEVLDLLDIAIKLDPKEFNNYLAYASISKQLSKDYPTEYIKKANRFIPKDDWYNRACLESVKDNIELAFEYFQKAAVNENFDSKWAWNDPDLQWIREDPHFKEIVGPKPE